MNCKIVRDLLPLYHDEVASKESCELVEDHLKTCAECRKMLEDIHECVSINNAPNMEQPMVSGLMTVKKRLRRKTVSKIAVSIICAVAFVSVLTFGVFFYETPVPYSEVIRTVTQPVNSALDFITNIRGHKSVAVSLRGDALYICYLDTFWTRFVVQPDGYLQLEIPDTPTAPTAPVAPGISFANIPEPPVAPNAPNPLIQISEVTKVFYYEGRISKFSQDSANAILLWEKPQ